MPAHDLPNYHDVSVTGFTVKVRKPREVILLNSTVPFVLGMFLVSVVFTIWPEALEHTPIGFEQRGLIHHIWHYSLLFGSTAALFGQFIATKRRLQLELVGLIIVTSAVAMRFITVLAETGFREFPGLALALYLSTITMLLLRCYVIIKQPTVLLPAPVQTNGVDSGRE